MKLKQRFLVFFISIMVIINKKQLCFEIFFNFYYKFQRNPNLFSFIYFKYGSMDFSYFLLFFLMKLNLKIPYSTGAGLIIFLLDRIDFILKIKSCLQHYSQFNNRFLNYYQIEIWLRSFQFSRLYLKVNMPHFYKFFWLQQMFFYYRTFLNFAIFYFSI